MKQLTPKGIWQSHDRMEVLLVHFRILNDLLPYLCLSCSSLISAIKPLMWNPMRSLSLLGPCQTQLGSCFMSYYWFRPVAALWWWCCCCYWPLRWWPVNSVSPVEISAANSDRCWGAFDLRWLLQIGNHLKEIRPWKIPSGLQAERGLHLLKAY